jgi:acyl carrier protein
MSIAEKVKEVIRENVHRIEVNIQPTTTFEDLNATYLDIVQIVSVLEDSYGVEITDEELSRVRNVGYLVSCFECKATRRYASQSGVKWHNN